MSPAGTRWKWKSRVGLPANCGVSHSARMIAPVGKPRARKPVPRTRASGPSWNNQPSTRRIRGRAPRAGGLREAFGFWLKLGFISFGGPAGQIAIMHQELVERRRWLSERRFLHALNYCMLLPGPEAQQLATYIGWLMHRSWGAAWWQGLVRAALAALADHAVVALYRLQRSAAGGRAVHGIKPAVTAIVLHAAHRIGARTLHNPALWSIAVASFVAIFALAVPFPAIVAAAALIGYAGGRLRPHSFGRQHGAGGMARGFGPALIDDTTPPPACTFQLAATR